MTARGAGARRIEGIILSMAKNPHIEAAQAHIRRTFGPLIREGDGRSLFRVPALSALVYFRYSRIHAGKTPWAFFGLRRNDVARMRGGGGYLCFLTDREEDSFVLPFARFEHLLREEDLADDSQFKVNFYFRDFGAQVVFAKRGSFGADPYRGFAGLRGTVGAAAPDNLTHYGVQGMLGDIGARRGFDLWFPRNDLGGVRSAGFFSGKTRETLPTLGANVDDILQNVDVVWLDGSLPVSLFEVEHTTSVYSGLLRLCDVMLSSARIRDFRIVAGKMREKKFYQEVNRPTFRAHKLAERVSFMSYDNVWRWREDLKGNNP